MSHEERANSDRDRDSGSKPNGDQFGADVDRGGDAGNDDIEGLLRRLDRLEKQAAVQRGYATRAILSGPFEKKRPDRFDDRLPFLLEASAQTADDNLCPGEAESDLQNVGPLRTGRSQRPAAEMYGPSNQYEGPEMRHRSKFPSLVLFAGAMMAVAAAIAGVLVFNQDLVKDLDLFASDIKARVAGINPVAVRRNNAPNVAITALGADSSARAIGRSKQHASTLALARDSRSLPPKAVESYAMVTPDESREGALHVGDSPRPNDNTEPATAAVRPLAAASVPSAPTRGEISSTYQAALGSAAPPVSAAPNASLTPVTPAPQPKRIGSDELAVLMKRARDSLAIGDIPSARLLLERAAEEGQDANAALLLARTFDPAVLGTSDVRNITPEPEKARAWYQKAAQFGSAEAQQHLAQLGH